MRHVLGAALIVTVVGVAGAQERPAPRPTPDLKQASAGHRITGIQYCRGRYDVVTAGRVGDRAIAVFASVEELTRGVRQTPDCPQGVQ